MTRQRGFVLLGGLVAVVALVCAAIFTGLGPGRGVSRVTGTLAGAADVDGAAPVPGAAGHDDGSNADGAGGRAHTGHAEPASSGAWVGTWAAGPSGADPDAPRGLPDRSIRNIVHTSIGGTAARVSFSNLYGTSPLLIGHASVAVASPVGSGSDAGPEAVPGTMRQLTFDRHVSVSVAAGGQVISDPVRFAVPPDADLLLTLYTPNADGAATYHSHAQQTSYLAPGDHTEDLSGGAYGARTHHWLYVDGVDVLSSRARGTVVAFGDSITDGIGSTTGANERWPNDLADRISGPGAPQGQYGVVDEGIGGNQVLRDASAAGDGRSGIVRFRDDVLDQPGVRVVFVDLGVNDILHGGERSGAPIIAGLKELTRQAHAHGVRVVGSTLTPFGAHAGYDAAKEKAREEVNAAIRAGGVFDAVVDFDRVLRDPHAPDRLRSDYDSGDGLHPNDAGYHAMAQSIDLGTLLGGAREQA